MTAIKPLAVEWVIDHNPPLVYNQPPKPASCPAGWQSHRWLLRIEEGNLSLHTGECSLCDQGIEDLYPEDLAGEFPVTIEFHKETYGNGEIDVWWSVTPEVEAR